MKQRSNSTEETAKIAREFVGTLAPGERAVVLALIGDLGSGKTTFSQYIGETLGVREPVLSPTFIIEKIYELYKQPWKHLVHIDAYRLDSPEELLHLGWQEIISKPENFVIVEWADRVLPILPKGTYQIVFTHVKEGSREIEIGSA